MNNLIYTVLLLGFLLAACAKEDPVPPADLSNTWRLEAIRGAALDSNFAQRNPFITVQESNGSISGYGGCSKIMAELIREDGDFRVRRLLTSKDRCPYAQEETRWLKLLEKTDTFRIEGNTLYLINGKEDILKFRTSGRRKKGVKNK